MLPTSNEITYFLEVAQSLNLSRAAERLGITQPTLSLSIKKLEHSLGATLLIRNKTGVKLTKVGKEFVVHARKLMNDWINIGNLATRQTEEVAGNFTIGAHPSVALYSLGNILPKLLSTYKNLQISLEHDLSRKITEQVISFNLDFGIVVNPVEHPDLVIIDLCKDEVTLWEAPKNKNSDVLIVDKNLIQSQELLLKLKKQKKQFTRHLTTSNLEVACELTVKGAGVGILPGRVVEKDKSRKLHKLDSNAPVFVDRHALIFRSDAQNTKAAKVIIEEIKRFFE